MQDLEDYEIINTRTWNVLTIFLLESSHFGSISEEDDDLKSMQDKSPIDRKDICLDIWNQNRAKNWLISAELESVLSHTEKSSIKPYYRQFQNLRWVFKLS